MHRFIFAQDNRVLALQKEGDSLQLVRVDPKVPTQCLVVMDNLDHTDLLYLTFEIAKAAKDFGATEKDFERAAVRSGMENYL